MMFEWTDVENDVQLSGHLSTMHQDKTRHKNYHVNKFRRHLPFAFYGFVKNVEYGSGKRTVPLMHKKVQKTPVEGWSYFLCVSRAPVDFQNIWSYLLLGVLSTSFCSPPDIL